MGHHNLQQIYLRDFGIELSHTVIPCCSGLRSAPYGSQIPLIPPHVFIIVACYIYNKNNGMVILWSSFFFSISGTLHSIRLSMLIGQAIINGQSVTLSPPNTNVLLMVVTATIAKLDPGFE